MISHRPALNTITRFLQLLARSPPLTLDHRGAEAAGAGALDVPGEHTGALGEDLRRRARTLQERLHEEIQGLIFIPNYRGFNRIKE